MFSLKEKGQVGILGRTHVKGDLEHLFDLTISPNLQVLLVALNISSPPQPALLRKDDFPEKINQLVGYVSSFFWEGSLILTKNPKPTISTYQAQHLALGCVFGAAA